MSKIHVISIAACLAICCLIGICRADESQHLKIVPRHELITGIGEFPQKVKRTKHAWVVSFAAGQNQLVSRFCEGGYLVERATHLEENRTKDRVVC